MPRINSPIPSSLRSECKKASRILASFVDPKQAFGPDKVIPPEILRKAKGLAIITVLKAGFLFSGRVGSGLVIARLPDGSWSAPSAIVTAGAGFGGQIGAELTDFVMILNSRSAVETFSQLGSITLGGNISVAAGPIGRNAEASGTASYKSVAAVFSYSKTRGLFAGVSLEGSVLIERRDVNTKFYGPGMTAKRLLTGAVPPPDQAEPLIRVLNSRVFSTAGNFSDDSMYNDIPVYGQEDDEIWGSGVRGEGYRENDSRRGSRSASWQDDGVDRSDRRTSNRDHSGNDRGWEDDLNARFQRQHFESRYSDHGPAPSRPTAPKPDFKPKPTATGNPESDKVVALYNFGGEQPGDLPFRKGDIITIIKKSESRNDWWTGKKGGNEGIFPANFVEFA